MMDERPTGHRPRYAVPILQPHDGPEEIGSDTLDDVTAALAELPVGEVDLDVWLESPGGSADAAYRIALLLRGRAGTLRFVVLNSARSAATLMTLCADELYLADDAELGPLDAQLRIARGVTSARDAAQQADFLRDQAVELAVAAARRFQDELRVHASDALDAGSRLAAALVTGLAKTIDPPAVLDAKNQLRATEQYARRLLASRWLRPGESLPAKVEHQVRATAKRLVSGYPTHDFVIDRREALQQHLPTFPIAEYEFAEQARQALEDANFSPRRAPRLRVLISPSTLGAPSDPPADPPSGPGPFPRQSPPPGSGQQGTPKPTHRSGRRSTVTSIADDALSTGAIDLDDVWIWSLPRQPGRGPGRHVGEQQHSDPVVALPDTAQHADQTADQSEVASTAPA